MEHRWSTRTKICLDVDVICNGAAVGGCKTRDIGMGGVFLETGGSVPKDSTVELTFRLGQLDNSGEHKIKAKVVREAHDGIGLMFRDFDASAFRSLQEVLKFSQGTSA